MGCCFSWCGCNDEQLTPQMPPNMLFYSNQIRSRPPGDYIDNIHRRWWNNYDKLERDHDYIQWLFPTTEISRANGNSFALQPEEIRWFREDTAARDRLMRSYEMMLNFYGIQLKTHETGELERATDWSQRYQNLIRSRHNNLRITRIIRCLSLLGFENLALTLVKFLIVEVYHERTLESCRTSCEQFWIPALDGKAHQDAVEFLSSLPEV